MSKQQSLLCGDCQGVDIDGWLSHSEARSQVPHFVDLDAANRRRIISLRQGPLQLIGLALRGEVALEGAAPFALAAKGARG